VSKVSIVQIECTGLNVTINNSSGVLYSTGFDVVYLYTLVDVRGDDWIESVLFISQLPCMLYMRLSPCRMAFTSHYLITLKLDCLDCPLVLVRKSEVAGPGTCI